MPTGYTARICEGEQSMSEFVLGCARAFGACVDQRDDPMSDLPKIPGEIEESRYVAMVKREEEKLADLLALDEKKRESLGIKEQKEQIKYYRKAIKERKIVRARLDKMYDRIKDWVPPSASHVGLKEFMIEQLVSTIEHDGDVSYYERELEREKAKLPIDYYNEEVESTKRSVRRCKEEAAKEKDRHVDRGQWVKQLYKSLENDPELTHLLLKKGIKI